MPDPDAVEEILATSLTPTRRILHDIEPAVLVFSRRGFSTGSPRDRVRRQHWQEKGATRKHTGELEQVHDRQRQGPSAEAQIVRSGLRDGLSI